jgi:hypothetical protein
MIFLASLVLSRQEYQQTLSESFPTVLVGRVDIHNLAASLSKLHTPNLKGKNSVCFQDACRVGIKICLILVLAILVNSNHFSHF